MIRWLYLGILLLALGALAGSCSSQPKKKGKSTWRVEKKPARATDRKATRPVKHPAHEHPHEHPHKVSDHHHHEHPHPHLPGPDGHHHPY